MAPYGEDVLAELVWSGLYARYGRPETTSRRSNKTHTTITSFPEYMDSIEIRNIRIRVLGPPTYDRHGNYEVPIEDAKGQLADLRVWSKHLGQPEWRVGSTYYLEGAKQNPLATNKAQYETSANTRLSRRGHPTSPDLSLLHVSDTHLGRTLTDKEHMGRSDQEDRFLDAINLAIKYRVDAILHTGDIFDDDVSKETIETVEEHIKLLADSNIPIYFVRGHHGCNRGDEFLQSQTEAGRMIHLSNEAEILGQGTLKLYGMDADAVMKGLSEAAPNGGGPQDAYRLLAWHEAVEPLARSGVPIQQAIDASEVELDGLALGDLHKSKRAYIDNVRQACGRRIRLFYAGATTTIARDSEKYEPAVWLLQINDGTLERHRLPLYAQ